MDEMVDGEATRKRKEPGHSGTAGGKRACKEPDHADKDGDEHSPDSASSNELLAELGFTADEAKQIAQKSSQMDRYVKQQGKLCPPKFLGYHYLGKMPRFIWGEIVAISELFPSRYGSRCSQEREGKWRPINSASIIKFRIAENVNCLVPMLENIKNGKFSNKHTMWRNCGKRPTSTGNLAWHMEFSNVTTDELKNMEK